jgi:hypothetical protein
LRESLHPLLAMPDAVARAFRARVARSRERLLHAMNYLTNTDAPRSIAAGLVVVVLAMAAWLALS